jgi:hypothetical protein
VLDLQHPEQPTQCRSCQSHECCLSCFRLKKCKHFCNANRGNRLFKLQASRLDKAVDRVHIQRESAHAVRLRWCTRGAHHVTPASCTSAAGTVHASCLACLDRQREQDRRRAGSAAHVRAAAIDQNAEQDDARDAVVPLFTVCLTKVFDSPSSSDKQG